MGPAKLKGTLLEYIVRRLLTNCGFTKIDEDGLLIFKRGPLSMINGKGAAHDADVLMNPPIQMPFSYPFRLNFECKAYKGTTGLSIIRNALGLRYDINEFEVVTRRHLRARQNNRRSSYALDNRQRYNYQVGVASIDNFSKPAFEFAANNKIPLISLRWFLPPDICDKFHRITTEYLQDFEEEDIKAMYDFLKGNNNYRGKVFLTEQRSIFGTIYRALEEFERKVLIGLLESGDLLFLISQNSNAMSYILNNEMVMNARFHYQRRNLDYWTLNINNRAEFGFYLPDSIIQLWRDQNFRSNAAVDLKSRMFSKVFVFVKNEQLPFRILNIDQEWLNNIQTYDGQ